MSVDNFFTIGKYSTICSKADGVYRSTYTPSKHYNRTNTFINFMCIDEQDISYIDTQLSTAVPVNLPMSQRVGNTLGITIERHTNKALTIGGGEDNVLDTVLKLDNLIPDNSYLYCIPTATYVLYINVLYNIFYHTRVEGLSKEELPTTLEDLLKKWCALPKSYRKDTESVSFVDIVTKVAQIAANNSLLQGREGNYTIFLEQPKYLMAGILTLIQRKIEGVGPSLFVSKVAGDYSVTEFTESVKLCVNIKKLYSSCLSCPIADTCIPSLEGLEKALSPVVFKERSLKKTLIESGMEYIPPSIAAFEPKNSPSGYSGYYYTSKSIGSVRMEYRPYYSIADSIAANFIPEETRNALETHNTKVANVKEFKDFKATTCANCVFNSICTDSLKLDYTHLEKLQNTCPKYIEYKDLEISKKAVLELILTMATSGTDLSLQVSNSILDTMVLEIGRTLAEATLTPDAKKAIRFIEYMANRYMNTYRGMLVLPTKLIQVLNKYARYFTIKQVYKVKGDLFHSQYDTIYHNLGIVPSKADEWVVVKTDTLDMCRSEFLLQSSRGTLESESLSRPLFSTIGCKDFLFNVNYEGIKSRLRSPKIIKSKPNLDTLLLNLALLLTPAERIIRYGWGYGCQYTTVSLANTSALLPLTNAFLLTANFTKESDLEDPSYILKYSAMLDTAISNYWGHYRTRKLFSKDVEALSNVEYKKILATQEKALSKSLVYIIFNLYLSNPRFDYPSIKLRLIRMLRSKL